MKTIIAIILSMFMISSKQDSNKVSINSVNGIYLAKNDLNNTSDILIAVCKDSKNSLIRLGFIFTVDLYVSDINNLKVKVPVEKWQPSKEQMLKGKYGPANSIKYDDGKFISYSLIDRDNKISSAVILYKDDYLSSYAGEKIKEQFEIINAKTKKIIEICKSK